jgi:hypothetical protein
VRRRSAVLTAVIVTGTANCALGIREFGHCGGRATAQLVTLRKVRLYQKLRNTGLGGVRLWSGFIWLLGVTACYEHDSGTSGSIAGRICLSHSLLQFNDARSNLHVAHPAVLVSRAVSCRLTQTQPLANRISHYAPLSETY